MSVTNFETATALQQNFARIPVSYLRRSGAGFNVDRSHNWKKIVLFKTWRKLASGGASAPWVV